MLQAVCSSCLTRTIAQPAHHCACQCHVQNLTASQIVPCFAVGTTVLSAVLTACCPLQGLDVGLGLLAALAANAARAQHGQALGALSPQAPLHARAQPGSAQAGLQQPVAQTAAVEVPSSSDQSQSLASRVPARHRGSSAAKLPLSDSSTAPK